MLLNTRTIHLHQGSLYLDTVELGHHLGDESDLIQIAPYTYTFEFSPLEFMKISKSEFIITQDYTSLNGMEVFQNHHTGNFYVTQFGEVTDICIGNVSDLEVVDSDLFSLNGSTLESIGNNTFKIVKISPLFNPQPFRLALDKVIDNDGIQSFKFTSISDLITLLKSKNLQAFDDFTVDGFDNELLLSVYGPNDVEYMITSSFYSGASTIRKV